MKCDLGTELAVVELKLISGTRHTLPLSIKADEIHYAHSQHICIQLDRLLITKVSFIGLVDNDALTVHDPVARYNVIILWVMEIQVGGEFGLQGTRESQSIIFVLARSLRGSREASSWGNPAD